MGKSGDRNHARVIHLRRSTNPCAKLPEIPRRRRGIVYPTAVGLGKTSWAESQMTPSDAAHLREILKDAQLIGSFVKEANKASFPSDLVRRQAVIGRIISMGGSAKRLSRAFRAEHPDIPVEVVIRMGDELIRQAEKVPSEALWNFAKVFVSELILRVGKLVPR